MKMTSPIKYLNVGFSGPELAWIERQKSEHGTPYARVLLDSVRQRIAREAKKASAK